MSRGLGKTQRAILICLAHTDIGDNFGMTIQELVLDIAGADQGFSPRYASLVTSYKKALRKLAAEGLVGHTGWATSEGSPYWCAVEAGPLC
jgi:hypothetical protein